jgi:MFS family permease
MGWWEKWPSSGRTERPPRGRYRYLIQRRISAIDQLLPQRWNWSAIIKPLDQHGQDQSITTDRRLGLRYFWLDGLFSAISENFFLSFIPLFALAYGATNGQIGLLTATANLLGTIALFPGARLVERSGRRKAIVIWSGGGFGRLTLFGLAWLPFLLYQPRFAITGIIVLNGIRAFMANLGNPAWTALVADLVPASIRGRYFSSRNTAVALAALVVAPLAGWLIRVGNGRLGLEFLGYQSAFLLAFAFGMVSTGYFSKIPEPALTAQNIQKHSRGDLRRAIRRSPGFLGLVISAFIWNLSLQIAAPFFNVYLVSELHASVLLVGLLAGTTSLFMIPGQYLFGRLIDRKGGLWVYQLTGFLIPILPLAWATITAPEQVFLINIAAGLLWAGYNLANFNLLLELTPDEQRPRAVALYQTAVFTSAVVGPLAGGYLADTISFKLIFSLSGLGRLISSLIFVWFVARAVTRHQQI